MVKPAFMTATVHRTPSLCSLYGYDEEEANADASLNARTVAESNDEEEKVKEIREKRDLPAASNATFSHSSIALHLPSAVVAQSVVVSVGQS